MRRVLVLGAGRVGGFLAADLAGEPDLEVTAADASPTRLEPLAGGAPVRTAVRDLSDPAAVRALAGDADVIVHPPSPPNGLEKMRRLMLAAVERQDDNWRSEIGRLFRSTYFTVSPYRLQPEGRVDSLQRLRRRDVVAFYQRYAVPHNMVLAIFGDIDVEQTAAAVEQAFADLQPRPLSFPRVAAEPPHTQTRRQVKHTQKQVAASYIGFPGISLTQLEDRYPLHILDAIMSGIGFPGGWLHTELRGKQLV